MRVYRLALALLVTLSCTGMLSAKEIYDAVDYGAIPDGKTLNTKAIQKAIDACSREGGGTVRLKGGKFLTGTIFMKSNVTLEITEDSVLLGSTDLKDYPPTTPAIRSWTDRYTDKSLIYGENLKNIGIKGKGMYDGQGKRFRGGYKQRPYGIRIISCDGVKVEGVTLKNSPMWMQHYLACTNVTIRNIKVWNHSNKNNDGVDIDGCRKVLVEGCTFDTGDDAIVLKATVPRLDCNQVVIRKNTARSHGNAIKCGTESLGGFKNVAIEDCRVSPSKFDSAPHGSRNGLAGIALEMVDGGTMENVTVKNIEIAGTLSPIFLRLGNRARAITKERPGIGYMRNITISNVKARTDSDLGCLVAALPERRIENLLMKDIQISFPGGELNKDKRVRRFNEKPGKYPECTMFGRTLPAWGIYLWHVKNLHLQNIKLTSRKPVIGPMVAFEDARNIIVDSKTIDKPAKMPKGFAMIDGQQLTQADKE